MKSDAEKLAVLIQFQRWRTGDEYDDVEMPDPRDITKALDWAIELLSERVTDQTS